MTDRAMPRCPRCGATPATAFACDLCAACLLTQALSPTDEPCPYQVLAPIAEDARRTTYLAQSLTGSRGHVSLEIYRAGEDTRAILSRYARWKPTLDAFVHSHVSRLLDVGVTADGRVFAASEYAPGWPLTSIDARMPPTSPARVELARQVVAAIGAAHEIGLAHWNLAASQVRCSMAPAPNATILGLGAGLVVDGADPCREPDLVGLVSLVRGLGIPLPEATYESAASVAHAIDP